MSRQTRQTPETPDARAARHARLADVHRWQWQDFARRWAERRWCWQDAEDDITGDPGRGAYEAGERPDEFIDQCAAHWDLIDPTDGWGALDGPTHRGQREQLRAQIGAFMREGGTR